MSSPIQLYVYDLSNGLARSLSVIYTGKLIEAIWHTSIVVRGREYYFGQGIQYSEPGKSKFGSPLKIEKLGDSLISDQAFISWLSSSDIAQKYSHQKYHLLENNCNHFTNEASQFLLNGQQIPRYIQDLPSDFLSTPFGQMVRPMIDQMFAAGYVPQADEAVSTLLSSLPAGQNSNAPASCSVDKSLPSSSKFPQINELLRSKTQTQFLSVPNASSAIAKLKENNVSTDVIEEIEQKLVPYGTSQSHQTNLNNLIRSVLPQLATQSLFPFFDLLRYAIVKAEPKYNLDAESIAAILAIIETSTSDSESSSPGMKPLLIASARLICNMLPLLSQQTHVAAIVNTLRNYTQFCGISSVMTSTATVINSLSLQLRIQPKDISVVLLDEETAMEFLCLLSQLLVLKDINKEQKSSLLGSTAIIVSPGSQHADILKTLAESLDLADILKKIADEDKKHDTLCQEIIGAIAASG